MVDDSGEAGSKRSIQFFNEYLRDNGYDVDVLWQVFTQWPRLSIYFFQLFAQSPQLLSHSVIYPVASVIKS